MESGSCADHPATLAPTAGSHSPDRQPSLLPTTLSDIAVLTASYEEKMREEDEAADEIQTKIDALEQQKAERRARKEQYKSELMKSVDEASGRMMEVRKARQESFRTTAISENLIHYLEKHMENEKTAELIKVLAETQLTEPVFHSPEFAYWILFELVSRDVGDYRQFIKNVATRVLDLNLTTNRLAHDIFIKTEVKNTPMDVEKPVDQTNEKAEGCGETDMGKELDKNKGNGVEKHVNWETEQAIGGNAGETDTIPVTTLTSANAASKPVKTPVTPKTKAGGQVSVIPPATKTPAPKTPAPKDPTQPTLSTGGKRTRDESVASATSATPNGKKPKTAKDPNKIVPTLQKFLDKLEALKNQDVDYEDEFRCTSCRVTQGPKGRLTHCLHVYCRKCLSTLRQAGKSSQAVICAHSGCSGKINKNVVTLGKSTAIRDYMPDTEDEEEFGDEETVCAEAE